MKLQSSREQTQTSHSQTSKVIASGFEDRAGPTTANADQHLLNGTKNRYEAGNISLTKFQEMESKYQAEQCQGQYLQKTNGYKVKAELINARVNLSAIEAEYQDKISKSQSDLISHHSRHL